MLLLFLFFFFFPCFSFSEMQLSFFAGPSLPFPQDIKTKTYDAEQNLIAQNLLEADAYAGIEAGTKFAYFFHKNFGLEKQISYNRIRTDLKGVNSKFNNTSMRQERVAFLLSGIFRTNFSPNARGRGRRGREVRHSRAGGNPDKVLDEGGFKISTIYFGLGFGAIYSNFGFIAPEWGFGGKLFLGADFPLTEKVAFFFETQYLWAPDVGGGSQAQGENLKTSGAPNYNFSNKLFGPHHDSQFLSFLLGTKFKLN